MKRGHLTLAEQETIILWDNELDTASVYTHDSRIKNKLAELAKKYPKQFVLKEKGGHRYLYAKSLSELREKEKEVEKEKEKKDE